MKKVMNGCFNCTTTADRTQCFLKAMIKFMKYKVT